MSRTRGRKGPVGRPPAAAGPVPPAERRPASKGSGLRWARCGLGRLRRRRTELASCPTAETSKTKQHLEAQRDRLRDEARREHGGLLRRLVAGRVAREEVHHRRL